MNNKIAVFFTSLLFCVSAMANTSGNILFQQVVNYPVGNYLTMKVTCPKLVFSETGTHTSELHGDQGGYGDASEYFGPNFKSGTYQCQVSLAGRTKNGNGDSGPYSFKTINMGSVSIRLDKASNSAEFSSETLRPLTVQDGLIAYHAYFPYALFRLSATLIANQSEVTYDFPYNKNHLDM